MSKIWEGYFSLGRCIWEDTFGKIISVVERNMHLERLGKFGKRYASGTIWDDLGRSRKIWGKGMHLGRFERFGKKYVSGKIWEDLGRCMTGKNNVHRKRHAGKIWDDVGKGIASGKIWDDVGKRYAFGKVWEEVYIWGHLGRDMHMGRDAFGTDCNGCVTSQAHKSFNTAAQIL
jgi:hypothetical protein